MMIGCESIDILRVRKKDLNVCDVVVVVVYDRLVRHFILCEERLEVNCVAVNKIKLTRCKKIYYIIENVIMRE